MNEIKGGTLYLVPTPIGNLTDMTVRAADILQSADVIAAEDTRHTRILLDHLGIHSHVVSYHEHNKKEAGPKLIRELLEGKSVAQVSDAGMPVISDPGADLVQLALEAGIPIVPLPGPNAALTALVASGLDARQFAFIGFLPRTTAKRKDLLQSVCGLSMTLLFYEAPHRLKLTLKALLAALGNRKAVLARELTKKFETFQRSDLEMLLAQTAEEVPRGEYVILVEGASEKEQKTAPREEDWQKRALGLAEGGQPLKDVSRCIASETGISRREIYQFLVRNRSLA